MPVGAIIGGVASIGGAILGSKAQKKAANTAAQAAADNTAANNALAREIYAENKATLSPFVQTGTRATGAINALLGLGAPAPTVTTPATNTGAAVPQNFYRPYRSALDMEPNGLSYYEGYGPTGTMTTQAQTTAAPAGQTAQQQYEDAFANYRASTGYQFRQNEGMRALNTGFAGRGALRSGAAIKGALDYGQNIASNEFGNYLAQLAGQQGVGLSAAGAQAGVSTNFVGQTTANNNSAASALANAALAKGSANANMWGGIAGGIGNIFGSSFG